MRYLKLASAKNPSTDFIELNDLNGFLCTSFQTVGISRKLEFLEIKNRQFSVSNKPSFKKYSLTIEILSKYSEYEAKHRQLISFLDRNKKDGFRLYYRPYDGMDTRYILCDVESSTRPEKMQPILLNLVQCSLWLSEIKEGTPIVVEENKENLFAFKEDDGIENYYSASFSLDEDIENYYCIEFYEGIAVEVSIENNSYNEVPLNIRVYGYCANPTIMLFRKGEKEPFRKTKINAFVDVGYYIEINSNIRENGVWIVNTNTMEKKDLYDAVESGSSPYFYIDSGEYIVRVEDENENACKTDIFYQEEYNE